jgi:hypothetical protein
MYGVMSHVPGMINRQALWGMLDDLTQYSVVASVPSNNRFCSERARFAKQIKSGMTYRQATEIGDLYYTREIESAGKIINLEIFYHTFSIPELEAELNAAGIKDAHVGVSSIFTPAFLSFRPRLHKFDGIVSDRYSALVGDILDTGFPSALGSYLLCDWDKCQYQHASKVLGRLATSNSALISR